MTAVVIDGHQNDDARREAIHAGEISVLPVSESSLALVELARSLIEEAFSPLNPETAQHDMTVERYADTLKALKPRFIHHPLCKELIPGMLEAAGCNLDDMYFDVPRLRSSTSDDYLTGGIAYVFHPHRDTWYSAPMAQINWWMPVYPVTTENAMAFHPRYWQQPVENTSDTYNYQEWNASQRFNLDKHMKKDTRVQPRAKSPLNLDDDIVVISPPGSPMLFSAAQLHSSVPNRSGVTRFSIDFRCVHKRDLEREAGAVNVDSRCTGSAIGDYLNARTLTQLPTHILRQYQHGHPQKPQV